MCGRPRSPRSIASSNHRGKVDGLRGPNLPIPIKRNLLSHTVPNARGLVYAAVYSLSVAT